MAASEESERRLAEAMRAQAIGAGRPGFAGRPTVPPGTPPGAPPADGFHSSAPVPPPVDRHPPAADPAAPAGLWTVLTDARVALLYALLGGLVLGIALALLSLLAPGVLPALG